MEKNEKKIEWYNEPSKLTSFLIGLIVIIILLSQSFAIKNELSATSILSSILSHNSVYLLVCIYFILLKTKFGKKYFNYLSIFLMLIYLLTSFTSLLTVLQSFNLASIMSLCIHLFIVLYLVHTFFRGTRIWKDFKLSKSPFNEFSNDGYFYTVVILSVILLAVNLIMTTSFDGTVLALLDCLFTILFVRYIYLYWRYLDEKKIDCKNTGNFDKVVDKVEDEVKEAVEEVKDIVENTSEVISEKFDDVVDVEKISEVFNEATDKIAEFGNGIKEKVEDIVDDNKIDDVKDAVEEKVDDIKENIEEIVRKKKKRRKKKNNSEKGDK